MSNRFPHVHKPKSPRTRLMCISHGGHKWICNGHFIARDDYASCPFIPPDGDWDTIVAGSMAKPIKPETRDGLIKILDSATPQDRYDITPLRITGVWRGVSDIAIIASGNSRIGVQMRYAQPFLGGIAAIFGDKEKPTSPLHVLKDGLVAILMPILLQEWAGDIREFYRVTVADSHLNLKVR